MKKELLDKLEILGGVLFFNILDEFIDDFGGLEKVVEVNICCCFDVIIVWVLMIFVWGVV